MHGRTNKKLTQAQLSQVSISYHTLSIRYLLDLGLSGEDNSVIVPIDQPASPTGAETYAGPKHVGYTNNGKSRLLDQLTMANIHSHSRVPSQDVASRCGYGVLVSSGYARSGIDQYAFLVLSWR
ncbi:hypothetical protein Tco_0995095 [Tanacetum coccineum]